MNSLLFAIFTFVLYTHLPAKEIDWPYGTIHVVGSSHSPFLFTNSGSWHNFLAIVDKNGQPDEKLYENSVFHFESKSGNSYTVPFHIHWRPKTMYKIGKQCTVDFKPVGRKTGEFIVYLYGGHDVRYSIGKLIREQGQVFEEILDPLISQYIHVIKRNERITKSRAVIVGVVPPNRRDYEFIEREYPELASNTSFEERCLFTARVNARLEEECNRRRILFFNHFEPFIDANGTLMDEFTDGVHILPEFNPIFKTNFLQFLLDHSSRNLDK